MQKRITFVDAIHQTLVRYADKTAVIVGDRSITFSQLDQRAKRIASHLSRRLHQADVHSGHAQRIGVCMEKSEWLMPAIWAVVSSGHTYVPIDPHMPDQRIRDILDDGQLAFILTDAANHSRFAPERSLNVPLLASEESKDEADGPTLSPEEPTEGNGTEIAYIIYTSGTTGKPKGIPISYANLSSLILNASRPDVFGFSDKSVLMLFASITFDTSIVPIFGSLYYGATQVIATSEERVNPHLLNDLLLRHGVTYVCLPPLLIGQLPQFDFPQMQTLVSAGEALPQSVADLAMGHSYRFVNGYGPTEGTVFSHLCDVTSERPSRNIGLPLPGYVAYVVDDNMRLLPQGEMGEMLIGGPQLTAGYLNLPERNAKAFVPNPFDTSEQVRVLYHTGDLVRLQQDGTFDYVGRKDSQVKVRGYRIELGDVRHHLEQCPNVRQAYLSVDTLGDETYLTAYVLPRRPHQGFNEEKTLLRKALPEYMLPTYWVEVDHFDTNLNGKLDKTRLVNTVLQQLSRNDGPKTPTEQTIADVFAHVFHLPDVNIDADLIDQLGLTSMQSMQAVAELGFTGLSIAAENILECRTIRRLAQVHALPPCHWLHTPVKGRPVLVVVSGYTSFVYLYAQWGELLKDDYNIFVIESYHDNATSTLRTTDDYVRGYLQLLQPVMQNYGIDVITGFCLGGEMGLYLAHLLYESTGCLPRVVVLDGTPERFPSREQNVPLVWKCMSDALNDRRVQQDDAIIESMPRFRYNGPVTAVLAAHFAAVDERLMRTDIITPQQMEGEVYMFKHAEEAWRRCYPDCQVVVHDVDHFSYLHDEERSVKPLAELFLSFIAQDARATCRPLLLLSNDDGYQAKGINSLVEMLRPLADILVCAPEGPRSGYSCAFTANDPLRLTKRHEEPGLTVYSCTGTPVDCVKLALDQLLPMRADGQPQRPDMVIGGINHGDNGSVNAHYSGTMGVTMEGCLKYIPSVAFSLCDHDPDADFSPLEPYIVSITRRVLDEGLPKGVCLNVNFPLVERFLGVKVCRMAFGTWYNEVETRHHMRGYDYHWMMGHYRNDEPEAEDTDNWALSHGYIAITPTTMDVTAHDWLHTMGQSWE